MSTSATPAQHAVCASQRVGVEIEFGDILFADAVEVMSRWLGVEPEPTSDYELLFRTDDYDGPFRLELDWELLKQLARDDAESPDAWRSGAVELLGELGERWVPVELVTPPLPVGELAALDEPLAELARLGAAGTQSSVFAAYGTHLNPEVIPLTIGNILPQLQAFVVLQHWIVATAEVDLTRRLSQYAKLFDRGYEALLLADDYAPVMPALIDDYLAHNPTRNRALDMLPLFAEIDDARVRRVVDDGRIKARPTFHYRLMDCRLGEPGWTVGTAWQSWRAVERLAAAPQLLRRLCEARVEYLGRAPVLATDQQWIDLCQQVINDLPSE